MKEELISIIIPVYNAEKYLKETVKTIENQTYDNWEAIFVDDASTDKSYKILQKYQKEKIKVIKLEKNYGPAIARNAGLEEAKGRYIAYLDADDLWEKDKLKEQLEFMKKHNYAFTYTGFCYMNEEGNKITNPIKVQESLNYKQALKNIRILTIAVMIDLEKIEKEDCKMPNLENEDIATWWYLLKKENTAYGLPKSLAYYRMVKNSRCSNKWKNSKCRWKLYREVEKLSFTSSSYYFIHYVINAILKRKEMIKF